jgi:hypothetical protein
VDSPGSKGTDVTSFSIQDRRKQHHQFCFSSKVRYSPKIKAGKFRPCFVGYFIRVPGKIQASTSFGDDGHVEMASVCEKLCRKFLGRTWKLKGLESFRCALCNERRQQFNFMCRQVPFGHPKRRTKTKTSTSRSLLSACSASRE